MKVDYYSLLSPWICDQTTSYCSKTFLIAFANESIDLSDLCSFSIELDTQKLYSPLFLDVELYFSDLKMIGGMDNLKNYYTALENIADFRSIEQKTVQVSSIANGLHHAIELSFSNHFSSCVELEVYSIITGFKYYLKKEGPSLAEVMFENYNKSNEEDMKEVLEKYAFCAVSNYRELMLLYNKFYKEDLNSEERKKEDIGTDLPLSHTELKELVKSKGLYEIVLADKDAVEIKLLDSVNELTKTNMEFWTQYMNFLTHSPRDMELHLLREYKKAIDEHCKHFIIKSEKRVAEMNSIADKSMKKNHKKILDAIYISRSRDHITPLPVKFSMKIATRNHHIRK